MARVSFVMSQPRRGAERHWCRVRSIATGAVPSHHGVLRLLLPLLVVHRAVAQDGRASTHPLPDAAVQSRGGVDNSGTVRGDLEVRWRFKAPHAIRGLSVVRGFVVI